MNIIEKVKKTLIQEIEASIKKANLAEDIPEIKVVRTKNITLKPMDVEEARLQMELLGHDFFIFTDRETDGTSIVYRRKDGKYGLIETTE